jgi:hypothetical protein
MIYRSFSYVFSLDYWRRKEGGGGFLDGGVLFCEF